MTPLPSRRAMLSGAGAIAATAALAACTSGGNTVADQAKAGDNKGYIAGDGSIVTIDPDERAEPVTLSGDTLDGDTFSVEDHRGSVMLVNLWASWCGPCAKEAPELVSLHERYEPEGVVFLGIDYREPSLETGRAQAEAWGLTYPSIFDQTGSTVLDMQGKLAAQPSTAILDTQGRIAAVVLGATTEATLAALIDDVAAESGG